MASESSTTTTMPITEARLCEIPTEKGLILLPYELHRRRGLRYLRVTVNEADLVTLKVPYRISEAIAIDYLRQQGEWLLRMIESLPKRACLIDHLSRHPWVSVAGQRMRLEIQEQMRPTEVRIDRAQALVTFQTDQRRGREWALIDALRALASHVLATRTRELARRYGLHPGRITVRDQRSRWGSCAESGNISLNWRLILLEPHLQDHVILHELAHLRHLNHSQAYWAFLRSLDPETTRHDRELTRVSSVVMRLGRPDGRAPGRASVQICE